MNIYIVPYTNIFIIALLWNAIVKFIIEITTRRVIMPSSQITPINRLTQSVYKLNDNIPVNNGPVDV
jgi:hypothetical protein